MDPNLPLFRVLIRLAHGVGLPVDAVKKIRNEFLSWYYQTMTLVGNRRLTHNPQGQSFFIQQKGWSGTNRMSNRSKIMRRYNVWWDNLILGRWSGESYGEGIWIHDR